MSRATMFAADELIDGRYRVCRLIGRGGTGEIYEVEDVESGDHLALKTILPEIADSEKTAQRFKREIKYSRAISHPNVLQIHRLIFWPHHDPEWSAPIDLPCLVMELLEGETLADRFQRQRRMSPEEARPIVGQIALALAAAHDAKIVHRDLKPDNIFLVPGDRGSGSPHVVLTDFGVARTTRQTDEPLTASNVVLGTPSYMAPEQLELERAVPASDIYSLGLIAYEMVTGVFAFEHEVPIQAVFNRVKITPERPSKHVPDLDPRWDETIMRCLERQPEDRFSDARQIIEALEGRHVVPRRERDDRRPSDRVAERGAEQDDARLPPMVLAALSVVLLLALVIFFAINF